MTRDMPVGTLRGGAVPLRPFFVPVIALTLLGISSLFLRHHDATGHALLVGKRSKSAECRAVHQAEDRCAFVLENCQDDEAGLLSYLTFYYCTLASAQPLAFTIIAVWLGLLFTTIGIAASDFFSVNLSTIASILGLSESLAGVTFLALGNGSPDVFSTFAAMGSNSASMAVGELIGAASFITAVVAGSMALVREFKVSRKTYVRDICFFIVAVAFAMVFLADGYLDLWECCAMISYYMFYVVTVVWWHWYSTRRRLRREKEAAARAHVYGTAQSSEELAPEPYRDNPDDTDRRVSLRSGANEGDISALEGGLRIEIEDDEEQDEDSTLHLAAEMASSMRVLRPRGGRSNTTITPIRPSLIGALEFRSALAHLQKESNLKLTTISGRSLSETLLADGTPPSVSTTAAVQAATRDRALSVGDIPNNVGNLAPAVNGSDDATRLGSESTGSPQPTGSDLRTQSSTPSFKIGGSLAPPSRTQQGAPYGAAGPTSHPPPPPSPRLLQLKIPVRGDSGSERSSPISPFPGFIDSPLSITPQPRADGSSEIAAPGPTRHESHFPGFGIATGPPKPVRWWPYAVLPPPHILLSTLFPTLQGWSDKSIWDKFVSTISVPSIFLLIITLPVVETERADDPSEESVIESLLPGPHNRAGAVSVEPNAHIQRETEWQRYRRSTLSNTRRSSQAASPALIAVDSPGNTRAVVGELPMGRSSTQNDQVRPVSASESDFQCHDDPRSWNRWLVCVQVFTGPLFAMFILWANWKEELEEPYKVLAMFTLYTILASVVILTILLVTTSQDRRPRYHFLLCFLGFIIAVAWISTIAGEVVGVLKTFGVILGISEALLGLTVFAAGNSVSDLVADITVARLGYPVMALSACFGGPMLNILLGIGIGGAWMILQSASKRHAKRPDKPYKRKAYKISVSGTLLVSAITLLITLLGLLVVVPMNKWILTRKIGFGLIALWTISTIINVIVEVTGMWRDVT